MHLVGFIIRIYYDAQSPEHQKQENISYATKFPSSNYRNFFQSFSMVFCIPFRSTTAIFLKIIKKILLVSVQCLCLFDISPTSY